MTDTDIRRVEAAVETLYDLAKAGASLLEAVQVLANDGYSAAEIRLAMDMFHWNHHRLQ